MGEQWEDFKPYCSLFDLNSLKGVGFLSFLVNRIINVICQTEGGSGE